MADFITGITTVVSGVFSAILDSLSGLGSLIFNIGEGGAISGLTGFGWFAVVLIGVPLATWLVNKAIGLFKLVLRK